MSARNRGRWLLGLMIFVAVFAVVILKDYMGWDLPMIVEGGIVAAIACGSVAVLGRLGLAPFDWVET